MATRRRRRVWYDTEPRDPRLWLYGPVPSGFWHLAENRRRYVEWLGEQLGFTQLEDWYGITVSDSRCHRGGGLLSKFQNSPSAVLKDVFPHYDWKEWLFGFAPQRFWQDPTNRRRYLDWLGQQLGFRRPEDWYHLSGEQVINHAGGGLLPHCHSSLLPALKEYLPTYEWLEWRFQQVSAGFWNKRANRCRYLDWLGAQLGFHQPKDWYQLSTIQLVQHYGRSLLLKFRGVPAAIVKEYLPHEPWQEWRFQQVPNGFWDQRANRRRYLHWLGQQLGFQQPEDWYQLSAQHLRHHHGGSLLARFGGSPAAIAKEYLPRYPWQEWRFACIPDGFWDNPANRRRYLDWLGQHLGFRHPEDWYRLGNRDVIQHHGHGLVKHFHYSLPAVLQDYRPEYAWQEWRFASVPDGFWDNPVNRHHYLDSLGQQLGFRCVEDWYQISFKDLTQPHGARLLAKFGNSPSAVLKDSMPEYDWKEWLFQRPPKDFWTHPANRWRYPDWLGAQLGVQQPGDWLRLRATDVLQHRSKGLLKQYQFRLALMMKEYLGGRSVPTTDLVFTPEGKLAAP